MYADTTSNLQIDTVSETPVSENLVSFFTECLTKFKNGDGKSKMDVALSVHSKILSDEQRVGEMSACVVSSGLLEDLCCTLSEPCSDQLFVCRSSFSLFPSPSLSFVLWLCFVWQVCVTSVVSLVVSGASLPVRTRVSSLLPSLVGLISKSENGVGEAATRAIGHLCSVCLSSNDVEGILNCGIVEGLCSQCLEMISSSTGNGNRQNGAISLVGGLDALCTGLSDFISSQKEKARKGGTSNDRQEGILKDEDESEFSLLSRSSSALSLIESTLGELLAELQGQRQSSELDQQRKALRNEVAGVLMEHFPHTIVTRREKPEVVIGLDIGKERQKMEEERRLMETEKETMEAERQREKEEVKRTEMKRQEEYDKKMKELNTMKLSMEADRAKNQQLVEQTRRWAETERKRQSKFGAAAIEMLDQTKWKMSGNIFTKTPSTHDTLVSFDFGEVVARLSLIIGSGPNNDYTVGIISSSLCTVTLAKDFSNLKGGAGWNLYPNYRFAKQNGKNSSLGSACLEGREGQRVVLEADGREGKRTLKLSQDGETQPVFFTNIPVPFRFAVSIYKKSDAVEIESIEVVGGPQMVGGRIHVLVDE
ncbi:hypothetical protein BLNAU_12309 [Blattamonas nauphoetae]|uniref:Uncharacterized protein n=1 Tax=Blattamonas nauphoetae TaxID=2049346 RepID=A0ABQ9XR46_9EUKA|nr:hypothetical protein BLNAU_12309 [Blattamonas nauphoetae]